MNSVIRLTLFALPARSGNDSELVFITKVLSLNFDSDLQLERRRSNNTRHFFFY